MEVIGRLWLRFADAFVEFVEELEFRVALCYRVITGKVPIVAEKRPWVRSAEVPILADLYSLFDGRLIASVLIWPSLESEMEDAYHDHRARLDEVLSTFAEGAARKRFDTFWEVDFGLTFDNDREVWVDGEGHAYDARRMFAYSRGIGAPGEYLGGRA